MLPIKKICKITGREFEISELEQNLRRKLGAYCPTPDGLPDTHPYERMRELLYWRSLWSLYPHKCDLCGRATLTFFNPTNKFPKYCKDCFLGDLWDPLKYGQEIDFRRPFFPQTQELFEKTPAMALSVQEPIENSEYNNGVTSLKSCYMCFNAGFLEDCYYAFSAKFVKDSIDITIVGGHSEIVYECINGGKLYNVFWSEAITNCRDSKFLYDCVDCHDCFMSSSLRHKQFVFENKQLAPDEYNKKIREIDFGSHMIVQKLKQQFVQMKNLAPHKNFIGTNSENVSGNIIYHSKNVEDSYIMAGTENCVNCYELVDNSKDCLDVCAYGYGIQSCYMCNAAGEDSYNLKYTFVGISKSSDLEYCIGVRNCQDCFGCVSTRKKQYCILNKQYSKKEYFSLKARLIEHMKQTGEYGQFFPKSMCPFGYNEGDAQLNMPLTREEALAKGFKWYEKPIPKFSLEQIYIPPDNTKDARWQDLDGKVVICAESGRPFKIIKQEFDFYKKYSVPLPRLHPEVRHFKRYPRQEVFNLHKAHCAQCGASIDTSEPKEVAVLCEKCYKKSTY